MEIYKTMRRQISNKSSKMTEAFSSPTGAKYGGGSGKTWIHPPDVLLNGRVEYSVKFLGTKDVPEAKGTEVIRDAIQAIRFQLQVKRAEVGHAGAKLQKVDIQINIEGVTLVDSKTKAILYKYPLQRISFCADDKDDKRLFSFIAKSAQDSNRHDCYVLLSDKLASQITLTVGEAFDLAYKRYMDTNKSALENKKQVLLLRKRIADLESENQVLSERLAETIRDNYSKAARHSDSLLDAPQLPATPIPRSPPNNQTPFTNSIYSVPQTSLSQSTVPLALGADPFADLIKTPSSCPPLVNTEIATNGSTHSSPSGPPPSFPPPTISGTTQPTSLAPPPPVAPRRNLPSKAQTDVGRKLEGLDLEKMEDKFDDDFDPRAEEKRKKDEEERKSKANADSFGDSFLDEVLSVGQAAGNMTLQTADKAKPTSSELEQMIANVDKRISELQSGFSGGLEIGQMESGDTLKDLEENEYGTPSDIVNREAVTGKKN